jgi:hypothetical protein
MTLANDRSVRDYELEADETRVRLSSSLDELARNLTPGHVLDEVLTYTRAGGGDFLRGLGSAASSNPVPTLLIGLGAAMFLTGKGRVGPSAKHSRSNGEGVLRHAADAARTRGPVVAGPLARQAAQDWPDEDVVRDRTRRSSAGIGDMAAGAGRSAASAVSGAAGAVGSAASSAAGAVGSAASSAAGAVGSAAAGVAEQVRSGASAAGSAASDAARSVSDSVTAGVAAAGNLAAGAGALVSEAAGTVAETVGQYAGTAREAVADQGGRIFDETNRLTHGLVERTGRLIREQPLAVAATGLALGVAIAAVLPRTKTEDSLLGETSDAVKDTVAGAATEQLQRAAEATGRVVEEAKNAATKEGLSASAAVDAIRDLGDKVRRVVTTSADAAGHDPDGASVSESSGSTDRMWTGVGT